MTEPAKGFVAAVAADFEEIWPKIQERRKNCKRQITNEFEGDKRKLHSFEAGKIMAFPQPAPYWH